MRKIGEIIKWNEIREGDLLEFVEFVEDRFGALHDHWEFKPGNCYKAKRYNSIMGVESESESKEIAPSNYGFVFKLVDCNLPPKLENGMVCVIKDGRELLVVNNDVLIDKNWHAVVTLNDYNYDLSCAHNFFNIEKIYSPVHESRDVINPSKVTTFGTLIWQRKTKEQLAIEEEIKDLEDKISELKSKLNK
jgi:hypothetical protein